MYDDIKELIFKELETGFYQSKLDLIAFIKSHYNTYEESEIIKSVEDVLSNIDKYEKEFKQTKT